MIAQTICSLTFDYKVKCKIKNFFAKWTLHVNVQKALSKRLRIPKGNLRDPENENLRKLMCRIKEVLS